MAQDLGIRIVVEEDAQDVTHEIESHLVSALRENTPASDLAPLTVVARDEAGALIGGLVGSTSYGWLLTKILWVAEAHRGRGLGRQLMEAAEKEARARGCHGAWLDTSSARAHRFYRGLGYEAFGVLDNGPGERPQGHSRHFLRKRLSKPV